MEAIYITFRSITAAQRGERVLKEAGIGAAMQRTPRWMQERGCGYSLKLRGGLQAQAIAALRHQGVAFTKVYAQRAPGELEEVGQ